VGFQSEQSPPRKGLSTEASRPGYFALLFASSRAALKISSTLRSNFLAAATADRPGAWPGRRSSVQPWRAETRAVWAAVRSGAGAQALVSASSDIRPTSATPRQNTRMLVTIREKIAGGKSGPAKP